MACRAAVLAFLALSAAPAGATPPDPPERRDIRAAGDRPFSDAVLVGDTLYLSGKLGLDASGKPPADAAAEARLALDGLKGVLEGAGFTMDDLVQVQVFCSDVKLYDTFNQVYRGYFKQRLPARAFIGSGALLFGARFEVQGIAVKSRQAGTR